MIANELILLRLVPEVPFWGAKSALRIDSVNNGPWGVILISSPAARRPPDGSFARYLI